MTKVTSVRRLVHQCGSADFVNRDFSRRIDGSGHQCADRSGDEADRCRGRSPAEGPADFTNFLFILFLSGFIALTSLYTLTERNRILKKCSAEFICS